MVRISSFTGTIPRHPFELAYTYSSSTGRQLFERGTQMEDASLFEEGTESVDVSMFDRSERDDAREREEETARVHLSDSD